MRILGERCFIDEGVSEFRILRRLKVHASSSRITKSSAIGLSNNMKRMAKLAINTTAPDLIPSSPFVADYVTQLSETSPLVQRAQRPRQVQLRFHPEPGPSGGCLPDNQDGIDVDHSVRARLTVLEIKRVPAETTQPLYLRRVSIVRPRISPNELLQQTHACVMYVTKRKCSTSVPRTNTPNQPLQQVE